MTILTLAQDIRVIEGFGGQAYANQTTLNPLGAAMAAVASIAMLTLPRQWALWSLIFLACFVATAQRVVVGGLDFNLIRLLLLAAFLRIMMRSEFGGIAWNTLDGLVLAFSVVRTIVYTLLYLEPKAFIFQAGQTFDTVGLYFVMRALIRDNSDIVRTILGFIVAAVPVCIFFFIEKQTGRNLFSVFGGVPAITMVREDRLRCQGAFSHPILAGCFWASLMPIMAALWFGGSKLRWASAVGLVCALAIIYFCASSTPVAGVMFGMIGGAMYVLRKRMLWVQVAVVLGLICLHMVMKAPVWHLIARVTLARGSTSYFRFQLIDHTIRRFDEWALLGTKSTAHWFFGAQDLTNHFVLEAMRGGVWTLALFVAIISVAFWMVGKLRIITEGNRPANIFVWCLGVSLFVHCANFIGVSYFGQAPVVWFFTLAAIASSYERYVQVPAAALVAVRPRRATPTLA